MINDVAPHSTFEFCPTFAVEVGALWRHIGIVVGLRECFLRPAEIGRRRQVATIKAVAIVFVGAICLQVLEEVVGFNGRARADFGVFTKIVGTEDITSDHIGQNNVRYPACLLVCFGVFQHHGTVFYVIFGRKTNGLEIPPNHLQLELLCLGAKGVLLYFQLLNLLFNAAQLRFERLRSGAQ